MSRSGVVVALILSVAAVGCGGGSGAGFHTSVQGSKPIDTLSTSEIMQLCVDLNSWVQAESKAVDRKENQCRATGFAFAALSSMNGQATDQQVQQSCQAGYASCESSDAGAPPTGADGGSVTTMCSSAMPPPVNCAATVDQYSACVNELFEPLFPPCNQLTAAKVTSSADGGITRGGPACTAFTVACPGAFSSMMMSMP